MKYHREIALFSSNISLVFLPFFHCSSAVGVHVCPLKWNGEKMVEILQKYYCSSAGNIIWVYPTQGVVRLILRKDCGAGCQIHGLITVGPAMSLIG